MYFQPSIFKNAISLLSCRNIGKYTFVIEEINCIYFCFVDGFDYIRLNILFSCYTGEYWQWALTFVLPVILVTAAVIPAVLIILIYQSKNSFINGRKFLFMTGEYKP